MTSKESVTVNNVYDFYYYLKDYWIDIETDFVEELDGNFIWSAELRLYAR